MTNENRFALKTTDGTTGQTNMGLGGIYAQPSPTPIAVVETTGQLPGLTIISPNTVIGQEVREHLKKVAKDLPRLIGEHEESLQLIGVGLPTLSSSQTMPVGYYGQPFPVNPHVSPQGAYAHPGTPPPMGYNSPNLNAGVIDPRVTGPVWFLYFDKKDNNIVSCGISYVMNVVVPLSKEPLPAAFTPNGNSW